MFVLTCSSALFCLHSFPTRRSSDLSGRPWPPPARKCRGRPGPPRRRSAPGYRRNGRSRRDRKSTRLNSSHITTSYAACRVKNKSDPVARVVLQRQEEGLGPLHRLVV